MHTYFRRDQRVEAAQFDHQDPYAIEEVKAVQANDHGDVWGPVPSFDPHRVVEDPGGLRPVFAVWSPKYGWRVITHGMWVVRFGTHAEVWAEERFARAFESSRKDGAR